VKIRILACLLILTSQALAATSVITPAVDPGWLSRYYSNPRPDVLPVGSAITVTPAKKLTPPKDEDDIGFKLKHLRFTGDVMLPEDVVLPHYSEFLGKLMYVSDAQVVAEKVAKAYRDAGYLLAVVHVIITDLDKGILTLHVNAGHIRHFHIEGRVTPSAYKILCGYASRMMDIMPVTRKALDHYALLIHDLPGLEVTIKLERLGPYSADAELTLIVKSKLKRGSVRHDNRGTRLLGRQLVDFQGYVYNIDHYFPGSKTGLRWLVATSTREFRFTEFYHQQQLGTRGLMMQMILSDLHNQPNFSNITPGLINNEYEGKGQQVYFALRYPILRQRKRNWSAYLIAQLINSDVDFQGSAYNEEDVRSVRLGTHFDYTDEYAGTTFANIELSQGINALGARVVMPTRPYGSLDYTKLTGHIYRLQELPANFSFYLSGEGQFSFRHQTMLNQEVFAYGGERIGRAFDYAELVGDHGLAGIFELRYTFVADEPYFKRLQVYGYYDAAYVWNENRQCFPGRDNTSSFGFGARVVLTDYLRASIAVGDPISRFITIEGDRHSRVFFSVTLGNYPVYV